MTEIEDSELSISGNIVILTHEAAALKFQEDVEKDIYHVECPPLPDPWTVDDFAAHSKLFLENLKPAIQKGKLITVDFNYVNVLCLYCVKAAMEKKGESIWLILSFFDDDETILRRGKQAEALLEKKIDLIDRMIDFPFIKKQETPADGIISYECLERMINEYVIN